MTIDESEKRPTRIARYEIMWERDQALPDEIRAAWHACTAVHDLGDIAGNLKKVMSNLSNWSHEKFGGVTHELEKHRKRMEELIGRNNAVDRKELEQTRQWMNELLFSEEMMWLQRSPIAWLKEGDCNTKYFHHKALAHAKKNRISRLMADDGHIMKDTKIMQHMTTSFFKRLYTADPGVITDEVAQLFQSSIFR
jgi:hypothetical protein